MSHPTPEEYQPRLGPWDHAWRLALCAALSALVWSGAFGTQWSQHRWLWWLDVGLGLVSYVLVFWRRDHPLLIALATSVLALGSGIAHGPATLAAVSLATRQQIRPVVLVAVVGIVASQGYTDTQAPAPEPFWVGFAFNVAATAALLGWGMFIGSRRELVWTLRQRALRAESEQEARVAQARATERARIAREMHDVLAHRISQISMQAGALGFRDNLSSGQMRESAHLIRDQAHQALTDLRAVLGVLRDDHTGEVMDRPQPTYADLAGLVHQARESGLTVDYDDQLGSAGVPVPDAVGRTLYRIVQEGMTNVRKHAPGSRVRVRLSGSPEEGIEVELCNPIGFGPTATPGSGLGLVGLSERADLAGGRLDYRREGARWVLRGWIPWAA